MTAAILNRLLVTLDVAVEAFAVCEVRRGVRLVGKRENAVSVHYVLSGELHIAVEGAAPLVCQAGSIVLVPPNRVQYLAADADPKEAVVAADHCTLVRDGLLLVDAAEGRTGDLRVVCGMIMASVSGSFGLLDNLKSPIVADLSDLPFVRSAYAIMLDEIAEPGLGTRALVGALMKACLVPLIRRHFAQPGQQSELLKAFRNPRLGKAVSSVLDAPAAAHSVASLACVAGMSRSTFAKEFATAFQMTPMEFVAKTRLHHAAELLRATVIPIKVIASNIGFSSRSHFSRAFREAYGTDPTNFRASMTGSDLEEPPPPPDSISR